MIAVADYGGWISDQDYRGFYRDLVSVAMAVYLRTLQRKTQYYVSSSFWDVL
jgi:hypothetical protein